MNRSKNIKIYLIAFVLLAICVVCSLSLGSKHIELSTVIDAIINPNNTSFEANVVRERIPRTIFAIIAGASLSISGALMQSITRNPIADPSILGVNTGAALSVVVGISFFGINTANEYILFALFGALITAVVVYIIASIGVGGMTPIKLALSGSAVSATLSSIISILILPRAEVMDAYRFWQIGSLSGASWEGIISILPFLVVGLVVSILVTPALDAFSLGDEIATGLGVNIKFIRGLCAISGVVLSGATTALAGPIGFVGIMIPHSIRLIFGSNIRGLIPMSALGGAILLTISDVIGRVLGSPSELEVGIITAFLGAPILILIARKAKVKTI